MNYETIAGDLRRVKDVRMGRRTLVRGRVRYYLRCSICRTEFNVSPHQMIGEAYICPDCDESGGEGSRDG